MRKIKQLYYKLRAHEKAVIAMAVFCGVLVVITATNAQLGDFAATVTGGFTAAVGILVSEIALLIIKLLGTLMSFAITFLIGVATYDNFAGVEGITEGWKVMRDIGNLGIVVGLLFIAFMSVFGSEQYNLTKGLGKFVMIAILINFSKTITLFAIDASQVIMLTFVNAFKSVGEGNIIKILKIEKIFQLDVTSAGTAGASALAGTAGLIMAVIALTVILIALMALALTLMVRIIAIWFLIVTSPIAIAMYALPFKKMQGLKDRWIEELGNWLILGPMVSFVIWLTFITLGSASGVKLNVQATDTSGTLSAFSSAESLAGFVLAIGMLLYGLKFSADVSGSAGKAFSKAAKGVRTYAPKLAYSAPKIAGLAVAGQLSATATRLAEGRDGNITKVLKRAGRGVSGFGVGKYTLGRGAAAAGRAVSGVGVGDYTLGRGAAATARGASAVGRKVGGVARAGVITGADIVSTGDAWKRGAQRLSGVPVLGKAAALGASALSLANVKTATKVDEGVKKFFAAPFSVAKGFGREVLFGDQGAIASGIAEGNEKLYGKKKEEYEKSGISEQEIRNRMKAYQTGLRGQDSALDILAMLEHADKKGIKFDPDEKQKLIEEAFKRSSKTGGEANFVSQQAASLAKKMHGENSIHRNASYRMKDGRIVPDAQYATDRAFEQSADQDHEDIFKKMNFDDYKFNPTVQVQAQVVDKDGKKIDKAFDTSSHMYQMQKAGLLGNNIDSVALNGSQTSKAKLRSILEEFLDKSIDAEGNSTLTDAEIEKAKQMIAATYIDGKVARRQDASYMNNQIVNNLNNSDMMGRAMEAATRNKASFAQKVDQQDSATGYTNVHKNLTEAGYQMKDVGTYTLSDVEGRISRKPKGVPATPATPPTNTQRAQENIVQQDVYIEAAQPGQTPAQIVQNLGDVGISVSVDQVQNIQQQQAESAQYNEMLALAHEQQEAGANPEDAIGFAVNNFSGATTLDPDQLSDLKEEMMSRMRQDLAQYGDLQEVLEQSQQTLESIAKDSMNQMRVETVRSLRVLAEDIKKSRVIATDDNKLKERIDAIESVVHDVAHNVTLSNDRVQKRVLALRDYLGIV
jgi:tetrahydromethanopterin S-methyltransferase subunit G